MKSINCYFDRLISLSIIAICICNSPLQAGAAAKSVNEKQVERAFEQAQAVNSIQAWDDFLTQYGRFSKESPQIRRFIDQARWAIEQLIFDSGSSETCRICHEEIYAEWKSSFHAKAWTDTLFRYSTQDYQKRECLPCHAPEPIFETGLWRKPSVRKTNREEGVSCFSCHVLRSGLTNSVVGPYRDSETWAHESLADRQFKAGEMCGVCHRVTHEEWQKIDRENEVLLTRSKSEYTCQTCHMSKVNVARSVGTKGPLRQSTRAHDFLGGHSKRQLREALKNYSVQIKNGKLLLRIVNYATAHAMPTGMSGKKFIFQARVFDENNNPVPLRDGMVTEIFEAVYARPMMAGLEMQSDRSDSSGSAIGTSKIFQRQYPLPIRNGKVMYKIIYVSGIDGEEQRIVSDELQF